MDKKQQQLLLLILLIGFLYVLYMSFNTKSNVEGLKNMKYPVKLSQAREDVSYAPLSAPQKNLLVPTHMMSGEVYRYSNKNNVSFDVYGYLHLINGSVFDKKVDQKYKVYIGDSNGKMIVDEELKRDGDDIYKLKLRDLPITDSHIYNHVIITFIDQTQKESIVLQGNLSRQ
jgi:hypothetical protein